MTSPVIKMKGSLTSIKLENDLIKQIKIDLDENFPDRNKARRNIAVINQRGNAIENNVKSKKIDNGCW